MNYYDIIEACELGMMNKELAAQALEAIGIDPCDVAHEVLEACELGATMLDCEEQANLYTKAYE